MVELPLEPHFGDGWGTPGDYRSFFVPTQPGGYTVHLNGTLGAQKVNLAIPSGPETFSDVNDPAKSAFPAVKDPTTAQLAQRLDREATRLTGTVAAATAAQKAAEDKADQARMLALGGLIVGAVGLVVGALAWGRRSAARRGPAGPGPHRSREGLTVPCTSVGGSPRSRLLAGLWLLATGPAAAAHGVLQSSEPAGGSSLERAPAAVTLRFSERPDPRLSTVRVLDSGGRVVAGGPAQPVAGRPLELSGPAAGLPPAATR